MDNTGQMAGARSPRPGNPGTGGGNVPFAGGMVSGNFGQQTNPDMGRMQGSGGLTLNINPNSPPPESPPPATQGPGGPPGVPGGPPPPQPVAPVINPQAMMDVYNSFFAELVKSVDEGRSIIGGIY